MAEDRVARSAFAELVMRGDTPDAVARIADQSEREFRVKNARRALRYREEARRVG